MKKTSLYRILFISVLLITSSAGYAQILGWQFTTPEPSDGRAKTSEANIIDENLEKSTLVRGPGAVKVSGNSRGFGANLAACETYADAKAVGAYFQFVVKAKKGYKVSLRNLSTVMRRQEEAANKYRWTYSLNGKDFKEIGAEDVSFETFENNGERQPRISLSEYPELQNVPANATITFRLYAWGGKTNTGKKINFGFGKSGSKSNPVLSIFGTIEKAE